MREVNTHFSSLVWNEVKREGEKMQEHNLCGQGKNY